MLVVTAVNMEAERMMPTMVTRVLVLFCFKTFKACEPGTAPGTFRNSYSKGQRTAPSQPALRRTTAARVHWQGIDERPCRSSCRRAYWSCFALKLSR